MPRDLQVTTRLIDGGYRYTIFQGARALLTSGTFLLEADARSCGEHVASAPVSLFDFLARNG